MSETLPHRQRWTAAFGRPLGEIASIPTPLLRRGQPIAVVGGTLAAALVAPIRSAGFDVVAAETWHPLLADIPAEAAEYEAFGNGYGEIDSARAFRQLVERAARTYTPAEDRWAEDGRVVDPFRPRLRYPAASDREFDVLAERHLNAVRSAFRRAQVVLVALSTSEIWEAVADGAVYPHWSTEGDARFDPAKHRVRTLTVEETVADLAAAVAALRQLNPGIEIVLMVSPEPQAATALPVHVLAAATLGKAVLRIAAETAAHADGVHYFPAYEIATLVASGTAFGADALVPEAAVTAVMTALAEVSEGGRVTYDGAGTSITVLDAERNEKATSSKRTSPPPKAPPRKATGVQAAAVDAYTEAVAAEKVEKEARRTAKRAAREVVDEAAEATGTKRAQKIAEREARKKAKEELKAADAAPTEAQEALKAARARKQAERALRRAAKTEPPVDDDAVVEPSPPVPEQAAEPSPVVEAPAEPKKRAARRARKAAPTPTPTPTPASAEPAPAKPVRRPRARRIAKS